MASIVERFELRPDELAFHFAGDRGVNADALANFLKRAAAVAKSRGGELRVVGLREGSLMVKLRALPRSKIARNLAKKFVDDPLDQGLKGAGLVAAIAGALIWTFGQAEAPLAKAGAEIVDKHQITQITLVTNNNNTVVMNETIAHKMREGRRHAWREQMGADAAIGLVSQDRALERQVTAMVSDARAGKLTGEVAIVRAAIHFQPDGYHYWVPIYAAAGSQVELAPGSRYRVGGSLETLHGQPDHIVAQTAELITG